MDVTRIERFNLDEDKTFLFTKIPSYRAIIVSSQCLKSTLMRGGSIKYTVDFTIIFIVSPSDVESILFCLLNPRASTRMRFVSHFWITIERKKEASLR